MAGRKLRIPCAIAFTVVTTTASVGGVMSACGHGSSPPPPSDGAIADGNDGGLCELFCIPDDTTDAGTCPDPPPCADPEGNCPAGCRPIG